MNEHSLISQRHCDECYRKYQQKWRAENLQRSNDYTRRYNRNARAAIDQLKLASGCIDCGYNDFPYALTFDHVRGEKLFTIGTAVGQKSLATSLTEIDKCEIVCANCHAVRTHNRDQCGRKEFTHDPAPKISDDQVKEIRAFYAENGMSYKKLGSMFGVSYSTISNVVNFKGRFKEEL